jgi:hypothetical protein
MIILEILTHSQAGHERVTKSKLVKAGSYLLTYSMEQNPS